MQLLITVSSLQLCTQKWYLAQHTKWQAHAVVVCSLLMIIIILLAISELYWEDVAWIYKFQVSMCLYSLCFDFHSLFTHTLFGKCWQTWKLEFVFPLSLPDHCSSHTTDATTDIVLGVCVWTSQQLRKLWMPFLILLMKITVVFLADSWLHR